jgi:hypothetical protein
MSVARLGLLVALTLASHACCHSARQTFPMSRSPDRQCVTPGPAATEVFIWNCIDGQHVVVTRPENEWPVGCPTSRKQVAACGQLTAFEQEHAGLLASNDDDGCKPTPGFWEQ